MRKTEKDLAILFVILVFSMSRNAVLTAIKTETSVKAYPLTNQASGLQFYEANDQKMYNITLWIKDWKGKNAFNDSKVTIYDLRSRISSSYFPNATGHVNIKFLSVGSYVITVQKDNRTVGYDKINVAENKTYLIKTWAYDLNMTLVDERGKPLANHTVTLYDQMVFQAPNYTIMTDTVRRLQNYTVVTDELGFMVGEAETDENGTLHFSDVWNGTYRLRILGKELEIEVYVLGKRIVTHLEPAVGDYATDLQKPTNMTLKCIRVDLRLRFLSDSGVPIANATVDIRNLPGHLLFRDYTNKTGFVEHKNVYVIDGLYNISARYGNRIIGHEMIKVTKTENFTVKCWAYDLAIKCVDQDRKPLPDHVVFVYDQLTFYAPANFTVVTNQTGLLVNWTKTDKNGTVCINNLWNGTYWIRVMGGEILGERSINLQEPESITVVCNKTYIELRFTVYSGEPLTEATVLVFDNAGNLISRDRTDTSGIIFREGIRAGNYTVNVEWMNIQVWSGIIDIYKDRYKPIKCDVYRLSLRCVDSFRNILPKADVTFEKKVSRYEKLPFLYSETDERGSISLLLPYGSYEVSCSYGIYSGSVVIDLSNDRIVTLTCNVKNVIWTSMLSVALPLIVFTLLLERRRLRIPLEIRRYKKMLSELESMYKNGLVEYRIYRKLREEYEAKIIELGGREMR